MVKAHGLDTDIQVDGGINLQNLPEVLEAGANIIVAGSSVFKGDVEGNVKKFLEIDETRLYSSAMYPRLFYLWGHTYEFDKDDGWNLIEKFCNEISGKDDTWYATNIEICDYVMAYNSLVTSANGRKIYNPTLKEIWLNIDGKTLSVKSGETINL